MKKIRLYAMPTCWESEYVETDLDALVDDDIYDWLGQWKWFAWRNPTSTWYATRKDIRGVHSMHRVIMKCSKGDGVLIDHKNRDTLDNQRHNLRLCTPSQNVANSKLFSTNTTGYRGVYARGNKWQAKICVQKKLRSLGIYQTIDEAADAYNRAAIEAFGEFATINEVHDHA